MLPRPSMVQVIAVTPMCTKDGKELLKENESINARWKEHFQEHLNSDSTMEIDIIRVKKTKTSDIQLSFYRFPCDEKDTRKWLQLIR